MGRLILDFSIFFARHMVLAFLVFSVMWAILDRRGGLDRILNRISPTLGRRLAVWFSLAVLLAFAAVGGWYLTLDGFAGEVEPLVASLSWLVQHGQPLYHELEAAQRYSVLYGPSVFLTNGVFLQVLGPSLFSAKLASYLAVLGCLMFLFATLRQVRRDWLALLITSLAALVFWTQGFAVYLVRPDAMMLFALGLALFAAVKAKPWVALVALAVMLGFSVNLKAHAVIYFIPVLTILIRRFGWVRVAGAVAGSAVVIIAPFVIHSQVSAANYIDWLRNALDHGLVTETIPATLQFAAYLILPLVVVLLVSPGRSVHFARHRWVLASLVPTYGLTLVLAAKPGAGLVHLLPLVPTTFYLVGVILRESLELVPWPPLTGSRISRSGILAAVLMTIVFAGSGNVYRAVRLVEWQVAQTPGLVADVQEIMARYPDITIGMACGGEDIYFRCTWLRPLLVFANNPLLVEPIAVMECQLTGKMMPQETFRALEEGVVSLWLVPRDQRPFEKLNWYAPHDPIFSTQFIQHFESLHSSLGQSKYFDLWFWNGLDEDASDPSS